SGTAPRSGVSRSKPFARPPKLSTSSMIASTSFLMSTFSPACSWYFQGWLDSTMPPGLRCYYIREHQNHSASIVRQRKKLHVTRAGSQTDRRTRQAGSRPLHPRPASRASESWSNPPDPLPLRGTARARLATLRIAPLDQQPHSLGGRG